MSLLFDVPKNKTRLELVKEKHTIWTHCAPGIPVGEDAQDDYPWLAVLMPKVWTLGYGVKENDGIPLCFSLVGLLIDERGYSGYGRTEAEAVLDLCRKNQIMIVL